MARLTVLTLTRFAPSAPSLVAPLRVAIGLASAYKRQPITLLLCDEGVLHGLKARNPEWLDRYFTSARAHGVQVWVDLQSMEQHGVEVEQLHDFMLATPHDEFWQLRSSAAVNLLF